MYFYVNLISQICQLHKNRKKICMILNSQKKQNPRLVKMGKIFGGKILGPKTS